MKRLALVFAVLLPVAVAGGALSAGAQSDAADLGSYALVATAHGFEATEDEPSAQAHPEGQGAVPQTSSLLANGPLGYGLSAIVWPGATAANGGALVGLLVPSQVPGAGVPVPDAVGGAARGAAPALNYPVKAEARTGEGAPDATYSQMPGVTMTAHADPARVSGESDIQRVEQQGAATYGNVHSSSESTLSGNVGRATASSSVNDVDFGGVIKIKSVTSTATAQTDGARATSAGGTVVQGMTIADQPAYVDDQGVHIGEQGQPANAVANEVAKQALTGAGMSMYVSQPQLTNQGGSASADAGSLIIVWQPPNNPSGNVFTVHFGGATVSVTAGEGFGSDLAVTSEGDVGAGDLGGGSDLALGGAVDPGTGGVAVGSGAVPPTPAVVGSQQPAGFALAKSFDGFGLGLVLLLVPLVAVAAAGSRRLLTDLLDRPAAACPSERDP